MMWNRRSRAHFACSKRRARLVALPASKFPVIRPKWSVNYAKTPGKPSFAAPWGSCYLLRRKRCALRKKECSQRAKSAAPEAAQTRENQPNPRLITKVAPAHGRLSTAAGRTAVHRVDTESQLATRAPGAEPRAPGSPWPRRDCGRRLFRHRAAGPRSV